MQEAQESAAEPEAQCQRRLRFKKERGVIELKLLQRIPQIGIFGAVRRIEAAVDHGLRSLVARERLRAGALVLCDGIAHAGVLDVFDGSCKIADLPGRQLIAGNELPGAEVSHFHDLRFGAGGHHAHGHSLADHTVADPAEDNDAAVGIV